MPPRPVLTRPPVAPDVQLPPSPEPSWFDKALALIQGATGLPLTDPANYERGAEALDQWSAGGEMGAMLLGPLAVIGGTAKAAKSAPWSAKATLGATRIPNPIKAYHGSPHDFDQFDLSKIGTGEGAQAYGHGLYFAQDPKTAQAYREALSQGQVAHHDAWDTVPQDVTSGGRTLPADDPMLWEAARWLEVRNGDMAQTVADIQASTLNKRVKSRLLKIYRDHPDITLTKAEPGRMYEVNLHASPDELLDWDKPLSEQGKKINNIAREAAAAKANTMTHEQWIRQPAEFRKRMMAQVSEEDIAKELGKVESGEGLYRYLAQHSENSPEAAASLKKRGIKGIQYLDQGSRGNYSTATQGMVSQFGSREKALDGLKARLANNTDPERAGVLRGMIDELKNPPTRNFVIFDDQLIEIKRKFGFATTAAAAEWVRQQGGMVEKRSKESGT